MGKVWSAWTSWGMSWKFGFQPISQGKKTVDLVDFHPTKVPCLGASAETENSSASTRPEPWNAFGV